MQVLETSPNGQDMLSHLLEHVARSLAGFDKRPVEQARPANDSRCTATDQQIQCSHHQAELGTGIWLRSVLWEVPLGVPPADGWPVVLHFQGSFCAPHLFSWDGAQWMPFGAYEQTKGIKTLLDNGYAVITPESHLSGFSFVLI